MLESVRDEIIRIWNVRSNPVPAGWFQGGTPDQMLPLSLVAFVLHILVFHLVAGACAVLDNNKLLQKYKMHRDDMTWTKAIGVVLRNQFFVLFPAMLLMEYLQLGFYPVPVSNQPFWMWPVCIAWMTVGHDVFFYIGHRILHTKFGFKVLGHYLHHQTKACCAVTAMYMTVLDFIGEIVIPYLVPLYFISPWTCWWFNALVPAFGAIGGAYEHSGYNFIPWLEQFDTTAHAMHHTRFNCSYSDGFGSSNIMDNVFSTTYRHLGYTDILATKVSPSSSANNIEAMTADNSKPKSVMDG